MQWNKKGDAMETCHLYLEKWKESTCPSSSFSDISAASGVDAWWILLNDQSEVGVEKSPFRIVSSSASVVLASKFILYNEY